MNKRAAAEDTAIAATAGIAIAFGATSSAVAGSKLDGTDIQSNPITARDLAEDSVGVLCSVAGSGNVTVDAHVAAIQAG